VKLEPKDAVQLVPVSDLRPWDENPRSITVDRFQALKRALEADPAMLRARPVIALAGVDYADDGTVVGGNMRQRAAAELVAEKSAAFLAEYPKGRIPAFVVDLTETQARQWALRDNNPYGEWEDQALAEFVHQLADSGADLDLTGFPTGDVQLILEGLAPDGVDRSFKRLDDDLPAEYCCPGCGYEWSGNPKPGQGDPVEPAEAA
jgi:ParB-like chromosome segregation protein Spo0J